MPFTRYTELLPYVSWLTANTARYADMCNEKFTTHSLNFVALLHLFDRRHLLAGFDYRLKATASKHCS